MAYFHLDHVLNYFDFDVWWYFYLSERCYDNLQFNLNADSRRSVDEILSSFRQVSGINLLTSY